MSVSILVVDDEPDVADLFSQRFRREARNGTCVMHFANSGKEALDKLATDIEPQLIVILSDINMPEMDGLELLREIKARRPDLPVMMVTAYAAALGRQVWCGRVHHQADRLRFPEEPASRSVRRRGLTMSGVGTPEAIDLSCPMSAFWGEADGSRPGSRSRPVTRNCPL